MVERYPWHETFSRQTGTDGEICIVDGGKGIGKTFGIRLQCVKDFIKKGWRFAEICRTKTECKAVQTGYFQRLQEVGYFGEWDFKTEKNCGFIAKNDSGDERDWKLICYFVALTDFQTIKKRTFSGIRRVIFDEAIIDNKDRFHRYLNQEFLILANVLDTITREQPEDTDGYKVYILGNSCDLTSPYFKYLGIDRIPEYGYHWYRDKTVLYHHCPPINAEERQLNTLVGRMLKGNEESKMIFENRYRDTSCGEVEQKTAGAKYCYAIKYCGNTYGIWLDHKTGHVYITRKLSADKRNVFALTKSDSSIDHRALQRSSGYLKILSDSFYIGTLRYESIAVREEFLALLGYLGIK